MHTLLEARTLSICRAPFTQPFRKREVGATTRGRARKRGPPLTSCSSSSEAVKRAECTGEEKGGGGATRSGPPMRAPPSCSGGQGSGRPISSLPLLLLAGPLRGRSAPRSVSGDRLLLVRRGRDERDNRCKGSRKCNGSSDTATYRASAQPKIKNNLKKKKCLA